MRVRASARHRSTLQTKAEVLQRERMRWVRRACVQGVYRLADNGRQSEAQRKRVENDDFEITFDNWQSLESQLSAWRRCFAAALICLCARAGKSRSSNASSVAPPPATSTTTNGKKTAPCVVCGTSESSKRCGACMEALYCSAQCQVAYRVAAPCCG